MQKQRRSKRRHKRQRKTRRSAEAEAEAAQWRVVEEEEARMPANNKGRLAKFDWKKEEYGELLKEVNLVNNRT